MFDSNQILFAILSFATSLATTATAFSVLYKATRKNSERIQEVHIIVNQQKTDMQSYQHTLIEALEAQGIEVPINPHPSD